MNVRKGSALVSALAGVACMAVVGVAGYSITTGETVCSLLASCDSKTAPTTVVAVSDSVSNCGAGVSRDAALVAMVSDASDCETATSCNGAKTAATWTMASGGAVIVPAALVTTEKSECSTTAATSCDQGATVINAALVEASCESAKANCDSGATVVNAAQGDCATASSCDKGATVVNAALATASCEGVKSSDCESGATVVNAALASSDCAEAKSSCEGEAKVVNAAQADCSSKASCDEGATVVNAALATESCDGAAKAGCDSGATVVNAAATSEGCATATTDCNDAGATDAVVVNAALASDEDGATKACCQDKANQEVVNVAIAAGECEAMTDECAEAPMQTSPHEIKTINASCPLTDEPITPGLASLHEGFTVGFCCNGCKRKWDARSDDEKAEYIVMNAKLVNEMCPTCPTMGPKDGYVSLFNGFAVGFCGDHCKSTFDKKDDAGKTTYVASLVAPVNASCPFSGETADNDIVVAYRGFAVAFCCNGCQSRFSEKINDAERDSLLAGMVGADAAMVVPAAEAESCGEGCGDEDCGQNCEDKLAENSQPGE